MIALLHGLVDLMSKTLKLLLRYHRASMELYEECVERARTGRPLWSHHPECSVQFTLIERIRDSGAYILLIQLLSTDIYHSGLSPNKSDQWTLVIKVYHLNQVVQAVTIETAASGNY